MTTSPSPKCREEIDHWYWGFNQETSYGFWLLLGIFNDYIKQNMIMTVLQKYNYHSVDICRLMKNQ